MEKQRVLLIRGSYLDNHLAPNVVPPLGILTLAALLKRDRANEIECRIHDTGLERTPPRECAPLVRDFNPHIVGISALSVEARNVHGIAAAAKGVNPNVKVVVGGPHSTTFYDQVLMDSNIDFAVIGEGEATLLELVDALRDGGDLSKIAGLAYMREGVLHYGGQREYAQDIDALPIPAWELADLNRYSKMITMNGIYARRPYASLFTSRACPYKCVYCHGIFGKKFRPQSPGRVLEEMELLYHKYGVREMHFYDDVFNFDRERANEIMEGVLKRGMDIKFAFPNGIRGDILDRETIKTFAKAGVYSMTFAIETATPRLQRMIKKNLDLEKVRANIEIAFEEKIIPCGFFMLGFPTETYDEMMTTIKFACKSKLLSALFFCVTPFPRSELYEMVRQNYPDYKMDYDFSPGMHYWSQTPYYTKISGIDMMKMRSKGLMSFYGNPVRMARMIARFPKNLSYARIVMSSLLYWTVGRGRKPEKLETPPNTGEGLCA